MACDAADTAAASSSGSGKIYMRIIGFRAPELLVRSSCVVVKEGEIQITMENVSTRQEDLILQVVRRFHFDRQRAVVAGSEDGFDGIE